MAFNGAVAEPVNGTIGAKTFTSSWKYSAFSGCFDDPALCFFSCCCPCWQFAKNYVATTAQRGKTPDQAVDEDTGTLIGLCCLYATSWYCFGPICTDVCGCMNRGTLREKYGINTGDCASGGTDCLMHFFCTPCALNQEWRELNHRWDQPVAIVVPGTLVSQQQGQQPGGPIVAQGQPVYASSTQMVVVPPGPQQQQPQYVMAPPPPVAYVQQQQQPVAYVQQQQQPVYIHQLPPQQQQQQPVYMQQYTPVQQGQMQR